MTSNILQKNPRLPSYFLFNQIKETIGKKYAHQIILEVTEKPKDDKGLDGQFDVIEKYIFTLGIWLC